MYEIQQPTAPHKREVTTVVTEPKPGKITKMEPKTNPKIAP